MSADSHLFFAAASVAGASDGGSVAAALLADAYISDRFGAEGRGEIVGDRMLIEEGRRRVRAARRAAVKNRVRAVVGWTRKAACLVLPVW